MCVFMCECEILFSDLCGKYVNKNVIFLCKCLKRVCTQSALFY